MRHEVAHIEWTRRLEAGHAGCVVLDQVFKIDPRPGVRRRVLSVGV